MKKMTRKEFRNGFMGHIYRILLPLESGAPIREKSVLESVQEGPEKVNMAA